MAQDYLAEVEESLADVRADRPWTGVAGTLVTVVSIAFTLFWMAFVGTLMALAGFLLTQSGIGALLFAMSGVIVVGLLRIKQPIKAWRYALQANGFTVTVADAGTDVDLRVHGPVAFSYRFAPREDVIERLQVRCDPPLPATLAGDADAPRLGAPTFDGGLDLRGAPLHLACVTAPVRAALTGLGRPVHLRDSTLHFAIRRGPLDVPAGTFDALTQALAALAIDLAEPTAALQRISAGRGSDAAYFDAARACAVLLAEDIEPQGAPGVSECVRAALAGDFEPLLTGPLDAAQRSAICRGVYRSGVATEGFAALVFGANALPDTEAGCTDAIGLLCAVESLAALRKFERLGQIGSMTAARWLSAMQFPKAHGLQAAADAARAAIHGRLHVQGALTLQADDAVGGVALVEHGQLSAAED